MLIKNKTEIELSIEDVKNIIYESLRHGYGEGEYAFDFKVVNKPYPCGAYNDSCDRHEFDGIKIVISK